MSFLALPACFALAALFAAQAHAASGDALTQSPSEPPNLIYGWERPSRGIRLRTETLFMVGPDEGLRDAPASGPATWKVEERALPKTPSSRRGWVASPSSLLLYDSSGTLVGEVGLGRWLEDAENATLRRRVVRGGASEDGRFAWSWESVESLKPGRAEKVLSSARLLRYLGTEGQELFRNELADAPAGLTPAVMSANGETVLVFERGLDEWITAAYAFTDNRLLDARGKGSIEAAYLAPEGRFGWIRWHQLDQPPIYSFLDLERGTVKEVSTGGLPRGPVVLTDDGKVSVRGKTVLSVR